MALRCVEQVDHGRRHVNPTTVTVTPERSALQAVSYDAVLNPAARVYRLGDIPDNFLARTANPLSIPRGAYVGSFAWQGTTIDWGAGGPLGLDDQFLIEQTRGLLAPVDGDYTFRTSSDDGSWLWVDGQPVIVNNGLHETAAATGTIGLGTGLHVVSFKYFERSGLATAGYDVRMPGSADFSLLPDALSAFHLGGTFIENPSLGLVADDLGGTGIDRIRWSWDGTNWQDSPGALLNLGKLANGSYQLRYQAIDGADNQGEVQELAFTVNTNLPVLRSYLPMAGR